MSDPIQIAIDRLREGDLGPLEQLWRSGYRPSPDEFERLRETKVAVNRGRAASDDASAMRMHFARFIVAYRKAKTRHGRGLPAKRRALREVLPHYNVCPNGSVISSDIESDLGDESSLLRRLIDGKRTDVQAEIKILENDNKDLENVPNG